MLISEAAQENLLGSRIKSMAAGEIKMKVKALPVLYKNFLFTFKEELTVV